MDTYLNKMKGQHDDLLGRLRTIEDRLNTLPGGLRAVPRDIRLSLYDLRDYINAHFEYEQTSGKFDELAKKAPRLGSEIADVMGEHRKILELLERIYDHVAKEAARGPVDVRTLQKDFIRLSLRIGEHERREASLFQKAYNQDIAPSD